MTDSEQLLKKEWLRVPRSARRVLRRLHHMLGLTQAQGSDASSAQSWGALPEELSGVEQCYCDRCDDDVPLLRLHPVKAPSTYVVNS